MHEGAWKKVEKATDSSADAMTVALASTSLSSQGTAGAEAAVPWARVSGREFLDAATKAIEGRGPRC
eukprot:1445670-Lingulodinium_polyedra.AAC.1